MNISPTQDNVQAALRAFLVGVLPTGVDVIVDEIDLDRVPP